MCGGIAISEISFLPAGRREGAPVVVGGTPQHNLLEVFQQNGYGVGDVFPAQFDGLPRIVAVGTEGVFVCPNASLLPTTVLWAGAHPSVPADNGWDTRSAWGDFLMKNLQTGDVFPEFLALQGLAGVNGFAVGDAGVEFGLASNLKPHWDGKPGLHTTHVVTGSAEIPVGLIGVRRSLLEKRR